MSPQLNLQTAAVGMVTGLGFACLDLAGANALQRRERATALGDDPHVDHRNWLELHQRGLTLSASVGQPGDMGGDLVVGEAQVVVDVPLGEFAAYVRHPVQT